MKKRRGERTKKNKKKRKITISRKTRKQTAMALQSYSSSHTPRPWVDGAASIEPAKWPTTSETFTFELPLDAGFRVWFLFFWPDLNSHFGFGPAFHGDLAPSPQTVFHGCHTSEAISQGARADLLTMRTTPHI